MLGTIVNTCTILTGSCVGSFLGRGISEKYKTALFDALGLATVGLGANAVVQNMPKSEYPVLFIASLAIGTIIGTQLDIYGHFNALLAKAKGGSKLAEGLSTAVLLFCIGTLSILGPIESRLNGNNTYLFTNAGGVDDTFICLRHWHCAGGAGAVLLAGQHLPVCRCHPAVPDGGHDDGDFAVGWDFFNKQRHWHFAAARLQDAEHAAFASGSAGLVYACKFFTVTLLF